MTENLKTRIWITIINKEGDLSLIEFLLAINTFICLLDAIDRKDKDNIKPKQPYKLLQNIQNYEKRNML